MNYESLGQSECPAPSRAEPGLRSLREAELQSSCSTARLPMWLSEKHPSLPISECPAATQPPSPGPTVGYKSL